MKEYIERGAVLNLLEKINPVDFGSMFDYEAHGAVRECLREIRYGVENTPAADVAEVRHGRWEEIRDAYGNLEGLLCECGREVKIKDNYCPSCGMKMNKDEV